MRITEIETLYADGGWRPFCYLKMSTDAGFVGWAEFGTNAGASIDSVSVGHFSVGATIDEIGAALIGSDPRQISANVALLIAATRHSPGVHAPAAIAALQNAMLDIKARALDVPVAALFGGIVRDRIELHWANCGANRVAHADLLGVPAVRTIADLESCGRDGAALGFKALKAAFLEERDGVLGRSASGNPRSAPNVPSALVRALTRQIEALRRGAGRKVELMLDLGSGFRSDGLLKLARAFEPLDLSWIEVPAEDPSALAQLRGAVSVPIATGANLCGRDRFRPFFQAGSLDVAVIDLPSNGYAEALRIAQMAEAYEVNVVAHHRLGPLAFAMSAQLCASIPNLRALDTDADPLPWQHELVSAPVIEDGHLVLPDAPGWGVTVHEEAIRARPARSDRREPGRRSAVVGASS